MALNFSANLSMLFTEHDFLDRFERAAAAGFEAVECQFPYQWPAREIAARLARHGLRMVLFNLPPGDWSAGERGIACRPDRAAQFRDGLHLALDYAQELGCGRLNVLAGIPPAGLQHGQALRTLEANLRFAANESRRNGIMLMVEAINSHDMPGFLLNRGSEVLELLQRVGSDNAFLQYDIYHMQRMGEDLASSIRAWLPRIGHMQFADCPGRHEPGSGEIDFAALFRLLEQLGYAGWLGAEYVPAHSTAESLGWLPQRAS